MHTLCELLLISISIISSRAALLDPAGTDASSIYRAFSPQNKAGGLLGDLSSSLDGFGIGDSPLGQLAGQLGQGLLNNNGLLSNLQFFTGSLGGSQPPAITMSNDKSRPYQVQGETFPDYASAASRSCNTQYNTCADKVNSSVASRSGSGGVNSNNGNGGGNGGGTGSGNGESAARSGSSAFAATSIALSAFASASGALSASASASGVGSASVSGARSASALSSAPATSSLYGRQSRVVSSQIAAATTLAQNTTTNIQGEQQRRRNNANLNLAVSIVNDDADPELSPSLLEKRAAAVGDSSLTLEDCKTQYTRCDSALQSAPFQTFQLDNVGADPQMPDYELYCEPSSTSAATTLLT